ncbi:hypothetical protein EPO15_14610 [bacterium]|nr:MAG: hypothetical protein EPO15_14610 [bacterium]
MKERAALAAALAAAALLAFGGALGAPPAYDDQVYLQANPFHRQSAGAVLKALVSRDYFARTDERSWQPLVTALESAARGRPGPVRAAALAAWAGCGVLVASLAAALGATPAGAAAGALAFTLFPAAAEALAVASFSGHVFALFFVLAAARLFLAGSAFGAAVALALGLTAKESAVTALPVLALLAWAQGLSWRKAVPALAVFAVYAVWRWGFLEPAPPIGALAYPFDGTLPWQSFGFQVRHLVLPWPLCLERTFDSAWDIERFARFLAPLAWAGAAWVCRRERPRLAALLWVGAAAAPVLHLIPFANLSPAADRYLLASAAPAAVFAALWAGTQRRAGVLAALGLVFGALAVPRALLFREPSALAGQTEACAPAHPRALALRGADLYGRGRFSEAALRFEKAFALQPALRAPFRDPGLFHVQGRDYVMGLMRLREGKGAEAEGYLREAVSQAEPGPARAAALDRLGDALFLTPAKVLEAREAYRLASVEVPSWAMAYAKQAGTMRQPEAAQALPLLRKALELSADATDEERYFREEVTAAIARAEGKRVSVSVFRNFRK